MKRTFVTNGKITYPQNGQALTVFTFINSETGDMFTISTNDDNEANSIDYGQEVTIEVSPLSKTQVIPVVAPIGTEHKEESETTETEE
ncbi:hypothetical protein [Veillonella criceti]|uniref:Uncharacterized protein n=1 Tax=Veillonella criceti TaxID=103891 RepID=A0A380NL04_9FIRM|nr:hypothetical protein [Veillonella criceti]SUP42223.1 Uncharacterised protein [Veillonella criceti]